MCSRSLGADGVLPFPTAEVAVMGPDGAANIIFRREIEAASDPAAERRRLVEAYRSEFASPFVAAAHGFVDQVIDPAELRASVAHALWALKDKREDRHAKKHGNIPL